MVSSGTDNCIKMWVFDSPDGTARLLRSREGHRAPPRAIRYYGNTTLATMGEGAGERAPVDVRRALGAGFDFWRTRPRRFILCCC